MGVRFFVDEPTSLSLPYPDFNRAVGYDEGFYAQTLIKMRDDAGKRALAYLGDVLAEPEEDHPSEDAFHRAVIDLEGLEKLDAERKSKQRVEQGFIRDYWFKGRDKAECAICGEEYPVGLLVAAHIKRRASCSRDENLDYRNNTIPVCKLGCDELFERGYIVVEGGTVALNTDRSTTDAVEGYLRGVVGRNVARWSTQSASYFQWHQRFHAC